MKKRGDSRSEFLCNSNLSNSKRSQTGIIVVVILIILSLVAVVILWNVVNSLLKGTTSQVKVNQFSLTGDMKYYLEPTASNYINVSVKRGSGEGNINAVKIIFDFSDGSRRTYTNNTVYPAPLETKVYLIDGSYLSPVLSPSNFSKVSKVTIYFIAVTDGKETPSMEIDSVAGPSAGSTSVNVAGPACSANSDCNDNNVCTDDVCNSPGTPSSSCSNNANVASCDDGNICTNDVCSNKVCTGTPNTAICNDGKNCNITVDRCSAGICGMGTQKTCSFGVCDNSTGNCPVCTPSCSLRVCGMDPICGTLVCGNCTNAHGTISTCSNGTCLTPGCSAGWGNCDLNNTNGCETELLSNNANCGTCGNNCTAQGKTCSNGNCTSFVSLYLNFTTCTNTGRLGPSQAQCTSAYTGTNLAGLVTVTSGYQYWTVPATGTYRIEAWGAAGGNSVSNGGYGNYMRGDFSLSSGTQLKILVGQKGDSTGQAGGGGGGSFVAYTNNNPLVVSGGGGGVIGASDSNAHGSNSTSGNTGYGGGPTAGQNGYGGTNGGVFGEAGAGMFGDPIGTRSYPEAAIAKSFNSTGVGGHGGTPGGWPGGTAGDGGFGGGGSACSCSTGGAGAGGGYSGGSASNGYYAGGGGGSYNSGTNKIGIVGQNSGQGKVNIIRLS